MPADQIPVIPVGDWRFIDVNDEIEQYDLTILEDGSFTLIRTRKTDVWHLTGHGMPDLENNLIHLSNLQETDYDPDGNVTEETNPYRDGTGVVAFVPYDRGFAISPPWVEGVEERSPYGRYYLEFEPMGR